MQLLACLLLPALACGALYAALHPAALSLSVAAGMAALYALLLAATRTFLLEQQYNVRPLFMQLLKRCTLTGMHAGPPLARACTGKVSCMLLCTDGAADPGTAFARHRRAW